MKKLIFVTAHTTTRPHLEAPTEKKSKVHSSFKPHSFTAFVRGLLFPENFGEPRLLYPAPPTTGGCKKLQQPRAHNYASEEGFFVQCTTF